MTSQSLKRALQPKFDLHSDVKLVHRQYHHVCALLECLFEEVIDLIILEEEYLNHKIQKVLELLPEHKAVKLLIAENSHKIIFAFKMNIDRCFGNAIAAKEINRLIMDIIKLKQALISPIEPYEQKIILSQDKQENFKIIQWSDLISFHRKKNETMIHPTQDHSFLHPIPYQELKKKNFPQALFYELISGYTINLNHLQNIVFIQNNYYHCKMSDGSIIEINSSDRTRLLQFLEHRL